LENGLNIYQRINEVRKAVAYVRKDKRVGEGGYLAVTHDAVTSETREHFINHGVVIVPSLVSSATVLTGTSTAKGIPFIRYEARYRFEAVNVEDPADKIAFDIESHAIDQGDKAPGKALSYAKKYAVLKLLEIESGEEEENRAEQTAPQKQKITPNSGAGESLTEKQKSMLRDTSTLIIDALNEERDVDAYGYYESVNELDEKLFLWSLLDSKQRRRIKDQGERAKGKLN
jgi:hypothetical protein